MFFAFGERRVGVNRRGIGEMGLFWDLVASREMGFSLLQRVLPFN
jgi:hypothetical protein